MPIAERLMEQIGPPAQAVDPASIDHEADVESLHDLTPVIDEQSAVHLKTSFMHAPIRSY